MKVLVADKLDEEALRALAKKSDVVAEEVSPEKLLRVIQEYDGLVVRSRTKVTAEVLERAERLKVISRAGVGVDNIDIPAATKKGVMVVNAPAGSTQSVAELTVALMLALARRIPAADGSLKGGRWEKSRLQGVELCGKTLGLVGCGRIGSKVADICLGLGMSVLAFDPYLREDTAAEKGIRLTSLDEVLEESDFVSIHAALTDETRHMIGKAAFQKMKRTAYLVNCARGPIVDEQSLVEALKEGQIAGAGLDVFEREPPLGSPLLELENVVLTPHIGASTQEGQRRTGLLAVEQLLKGLGGEEPEFLVNREVLSL